MEHSYIITVDGTNEYRQFELTDAMGHVALGTTGGCAFRLNRKYYFNTIELTMDFTGGQWHLVCCENVYLSRDDAGRISVCTLRHGDTFAVKYASSGSTAFRITFYLDFEAHLPAYSRCVTVPEQGTITAGGYDCDLILHGDFCAGTRISFEKKGKSLILKEKSSPYGVNVNGARIHETCSLENHDFVSVSEVFFYYSGQKLYFDGRYVSSGVMEIENADPDSLFPYPVFIRNTRKKSRLCSGTIEVLDPGKKPEKPQTSLVTALVPAVAMFALTVVLRGVMSASAGSYVIFSICSVGLSLFTTVAGLIQEKKKYKADLQRREEVYQQYIEKKDRQIRKLREEERALLREMYYSPQAGIEKVLRFDSDCFDRIPEDEDFLDVILGTGRLLSSVPVEYKHPEKLEPGDRLCALPGLLYQKYRYLENVPIVCHLRQAGVIGITGSEADRYQIFKNIVADLVCRQFVTDMIFYLLIGQDTDHYAWISQLPQLQGESHTRNIVFDSRSRMALFETLYKELSFRDEHPGAYRQIVVFVLEENGIITHPLSRYLERAGSLHASFLFFERKADFLPLHCSQLIELDGPGHGTVCSADDARTKENFSFEPVSENSMKALVTKVAPVYQEEVSLESTLRKNISMYELLNIYDSSDIDLEKNWEQARVYDSMAAPLGVNARNEAVFLDLHEKAHGPHGLVAGTTGSGKSELLQTYILSCALHFHPYEIGFVLIDFKGGGMAGQFKDLPHLLGTITNIDGRETQRSLRSIKAELLRRQELFSAAGVNQIDKYIRLYKTGKVKVPLPHLIIIVDEFAELKAQQPEFMKELISAARIGRSLGVHLILATQKPAGQVNEQIWSNSKFRLCLKVQDQQDSKEVIKSPLAAEIKEPGRAYLQVGNNEIFELFQSAYSGGPSVREDQSAEKTFVLYKYGMGGRNGILYKKKPPEKKHTQVPQLEALTRQIVSYCEQKGIDKLSDIMLPALRDAYVYSDLSDLAAETDQMLSVPAGIYDDPDHQYQGRMFIDIGSENTIVIGSSQMGKTNLLQLIIRTACERNTPEEVNLYILDFGSMVLKNFEELAHIGGVVLPSEEEKLKNLFKLLAMEMDSRKARLLSAGVSSFFAYREAGFTDMVKLYVLLDNFSVFRELYMERYEQNLLRICRDGLSLGISIVITNSSVNGIGYRLLSNFSGRICFTCNEAGDYSSLFAHCRMEPKPVPGRILFEKDKTLYEAQTYLAFEGEKEIDRAGAVRAFVTRMNERNEGYSPAKAIPCIPQVLSMKDFRTRYGKETGFDQIPIGLDFETIEPVAACLREDFEFAVLSRKKEKILSFLSVFLRSVSMGSREKCETRLFIMDDEVRQLGWLRDLPFMDGYSLDESQLELYLDKVLENVRMNKERMLSETGADADRTFINNIVVVNSREAIEYMSNVKPVLEKYKELASHYKRYGVLLIYTAVENAPVSYSGPEILKRIKDSRKVLLLDNLSTMKLFDIPVGQLRTFSKEVLSDEGYWITGSEIKKVKLIEG